jgi:hypothetical protein
LAKEDIVEFQMREGRVHHQGLAFGLPERGEHLLVRTHGSVGVPDQTLDITADVPLPTELLRDPDTANSLLPGRIQLHVGGTLDNPQVERVPGEQPMLDGVLGAVGQWLNNRRERRAAQASDGESGGIEPEAAPGDGRRPFGGLFGGRRRRRQAEAENARPTPPAPGEPTLAEPTLAEPLPAEPVSPDSASTTAPESDLPTGNTVPADAGDPSSNGESIEPGQSSPDQSSAATPPRPRPLRRLIERLLAPPTQNAPTTGS